MSVTLAIDMMGGDFGINITAPACISFLHEYLDVKLILVGDSVAINSKINNDLIKYHDRVEIIHTTQTVEMHELPQNAMRNKKDSSMRIAINLIKEQRANAIVSAGNTGALMSIARYVLRTMNGIDRPAIAKILPTITGNNVCMLDLGANVECSSENLLQFAIMGSQLMCALHDKEFPTIGLLNIGSENIKGNEVVKKAAELLKESGLNFYGNVEGDDINKGIVDVVVCDGFTGNIALKTTEGVVKMIAHFIKQEFNQNWFTKCCALFSYPVIKQVKHRLDPRKYNGAILLGLNGLVIKSHGGADELSFQYAIKQAYHEVKANVIPLLTEYLNKNNTILDMAEAKSELREFQDLSRLY